MEVPEGKEKQEERIIKLMAEKSPNLTKDMNINNWKAKWTPIKWTLRDSHWDTLLPNKVDKWDFIRM